MYPNEPLLSKVSINEINQNGLSRQNKNLLQVLSSSKLNQSNYYICLIQK